MSLFNLFKKKKNKRIKEERNLSIEFNEPILCKDGKLGLVIRDLPDSDEIGVQVPNEEEIRWIKKHELERDNREGDEDREYKTGELYQVIDRFTVHLPYMCGFDDDEWNK